MLYRPYSYVALLWSVLCLISSAYGADPADPAHDPFALDGAGNLLDEAHFGIVNGKLTCGVPYRQIAAINGLWAPPYASSDFQLTVRIAGQSIQTDHYTWHPYHVDRTGSIPGIKIQTVTQLVPGLRGGVLEITLHNSTDEARILPLSISSSGTLDRVDWWEFATSKSKSATTATLEGDCLRLVQGPLAVVVKCSEKATWEGQRSTGSGSITVPAAGSATCYVSFAMGVAADALAECNKIAAQPAQVIAKARTDYRNRVRDLFQKLPRFASSNPALTRYYNRSLVHFVTNRWDVPEFALHPNYTTGSVNGGCVCNYLWDFGEPWEIFPLYDPAASRTHIQQFVAIDMVSHFSFDPIGAKAWGPWYPVNQEKIVGLIYYYIKNTGDLEFLKTVVNGKTILEHALANALFGDNPDQPIRLIDYGPSNSHLELRRGFPYNHVMPDLNGRRYETYLLAAQLADWAGQPAPQLRERAELLKAELKRELWNPQTRWFDFKDAKGHKDTRYTIQIFKLFGSQVIDAEQEAGLLQHLNSETEFLSEFGLHSLSKTDIAYDQVDIDNGGGGSYTGFPPQIAERLYKSGHPADAENILKRTLWWGDRVPYWGDSFVANHIEYRKDTPLQNTIGGTSGAQCILFGMFGIRAEIDGSLRVDPPPLAIAPQISLQGLQLRGHTLDIDVDGDHYEVREGSRRLTAKVGQPILVRGDQLIIGDGSSRR